MTTNSISELNRVVHLSGAASDFACYAKAMLASRFKPDEALLVANNPSARVKEILQKAGVGGLTSTGSPLVGYQEIAAGFVASLAPWSSFDRIANDGGFLRLPLKTPIAIATSAATGSAISELAAKPITAMSFTRATLEPLKTLAFAVVSNELARSIAPAALSLIQTELAKACALATDAAFLAVLEGTGVASNPSSGVDAVAFPNDLDTALEAVSLGANSKPYLILPANVCKRVAMLRVAGHLLYPQMTVTGGVIQGIKVVVSDAATDTGVLVDASRVAAENEVLRLLQAEHASVQMSDNPTSGSHSLVSLWQNDMVGLRAERYFGVELLQSDAVALITDLIVTA